MSDYIHFECLRPCCICHEMVCNDHVRLLLDEKHICDDCYYEFKKAGVLLPYIGWSMRWPKDSKRE